MTTFNLTCEAVEATLPDYLDETLEPWVRTSIEEHLSECVRCAGLARELRNIVREAAALPALLPEGDPWTRISGRIGDPGIVSELVAESAPLAPTPDPVVLASEESHAVVEPPEVVSEPPEAVSEPPEVLSEPAEPVREPSEVAGEPTLTVEPPVLTSEPLPLRVEPQVLRGEPLLPSGPTPVPTNTRAHGLLARREKRWSPRWMGVARAAALVLVTAGTTFLLTKEWLRPARAPNVASDAGTRRRASSQKPPAEPGTRAPSAGRQQVASDLSTPTPPDQLGSTLTVSATAAELTPSPEEVVYDKEINKLQRIVRRQKAGLDTSTVTVIEKNLRALDSAISQIRAALKKDPGSSLLDGQASRALEMKVELLRRTAMLRSST
jgi:putative zinc finger protein